MSCLGSQRQLRNIKSCVALFNSEASLRMKKVSAGGGVKAGGEPPAKSEDALTVISPSGRELWESGHHP